MRELKFRAWVKNHAFKFMADVASIQWEEDGKPGIIAVYLWNSSCYAPIYPENYELMQYTSLKDKDNFQEIYEYDIINAKGENVGNYYENKNLLEDRTNHLIARMGTKEWCNSEQEAIKRGCKYAE